MAAVMVMLFLVGISMEMCVGSGTAQGYYWKIIYFPNYALNEEQIEDVDCLSPKLFKEDLGTRWGIKTPLQCTSPTQ